MKTYWLRDYRFVQTLISNLEVHRNHYQNHQNWCNYVAIRYLKLFLSPPTNASDVVWFLVSSKWKCDERMLNVGMGNPLIKIYRVDVLINVPSYLRPRLWTGRWPWLPRPGCWPTGTCWWPSSNPHLGITQVLSIVSSISVDVEPIDYFWMQARAPTECWAKMPFDPSCCFHFHCQKCKVLHYILCSLLLTRSENWVTLSDI